MFKAASRGSQSSSISRVFLEEFEDQVCAAGRECMFSGMDEGYHGSIGLRFEDGTVYFVMPGFAFAALVQLAHRFDRLLLPLEFHERIVLGTQVQNRSGNIGRRFGLHRGKIRRSGG